MRRILPDTSPGVPDLNTRQLGVTGYPLVTGDKTYRSIAQMRGNFVVARSGYGNFDTANQGLQCFGRTLQEVLTRAAAGQYHITFKTHAWVTDETLGTRMMVFVSWVEYTERDQASVSDMRR